MKINAKEIYICGNRQLLRDLHKRPTNVNIDKQKRPIDVKRDLHLWKEMQKRPIYVKRDIQKSRFKRTVHSVAPQSTHEGRGIG